MSVNGVGGFGKRFIKENVDIEDNADTQALYEELNSVFQSKTEAVSQMATLKSEQMPEDSETSAEIQELTSALADAQSSYSEAASSVSSASSAATSATAEAASLAAAAAATPKTINVPVDTGEKDANGNAITKVEEQPNPAYEAAKAAADEAQARADEAQAQLQAAQQNLQSAQAVVEETQAALAELQNNEGDDSALDSEDESSEVKQLQEKIDEFDKQIENIKAKIASAKQFDIADSKVDDSKEPLSYRDNFGNAVIEAALVGGGQIQTTKRADGSTVQKITKPDGSIVQVIKKEGRPEEIHTYTSPETASKNDKADRREKEAGAEEAKVTDDVNAEETKQEDVIKATAKTSKDCLVDPIGLTNENDGSKYDFIIDDGDFNEAKDFLGSDTGLAALAELAGDDGIVTADELKNATIAGHPIMVVATDSSVKQTIISLDEMMQQLGIDNFQINLKDAKLDADYKGDQALSVTATNGDKTVDGITGYSTYKTEDQLNQTYDYTIDNQTEAAAETAQPSDYKSSNKSDVIVAANSQLTNNPTGIESQVAYDRYNSNVYYTNRSEYANQDEYFQGTTVNVLSDIIGYADGVDLNESNEFTDPTKAMEVFQQVASNNNITPSNQAEYIAKLSEGTYTNEEIEAALSGNYTWTELDDATKEKYAKIYSLAVSAEIAHRSWDGDAKNDIISLKGIKAANSAESTVDTQSETPTETPEIPGVETEAEISDETDPPLSVPSALGTDPDAFYGIQINTEGILTIAGVEGLTVNNDNDLEKLQKADYGTYSLKDSAGRNVKVEITEDGIISVKQEVVVDGEDDSSVEYVTTAYNSKNNTWYRLVTTDDKVVESQTRIYKDSGKVDSWENKEYFKDVPAGFDASCKVTRSDGTYIEKTIGDTLSYFDANDMYELSSPEEAIIATQVIKNYQDSNFASLSPSEKLLINNEDIPTLDKAIEGVKSGKYDDKTDFDSMFSEFKLDDTNFSDLSDDEKSDLYQMMEYYDILQTLGINDLDNDSKKIVKDFENYIKFLYGHGISTEVSQNLKGNLRNICRKLGVDMSKLVSGTDNQNFVFDNNTYDRNIEFNVRLDTDNGIAITTAYNTSSALDLNSPVINSSAKSSTIAADIEEADSSSPESGVEETESADDAPEEPTDNKTTELGNEQFKLEDKLYSIDEFIASILGNDDDLSFYANELLQNGKAEYTDNARVKHTLRYVGGILYCDDEEIK